MPKSICEVVLIAIICLTFGIIGGISYTSKQITQSCDQHNAFYIEGERYVCQKFGN